MPYPTLTKDLHHEVELVVAIGKAGKAIAAADAMGHVWGYAVGLDMTRRDLQGEAKKQGRPWDIGKGFDHSAPIGPIRRAAECKVDAETRITLDADGILRRGAGWVALAPSQEPMMRVLLDRAGAVVSRSELLGNCSVLDPSADPNQVLDSRLRRLRDHVAPLGVRIVNIRRRGYFATLDHD